jgi:hypothetical protein
VRRRQDVDLVPIELTRLIPEEWPASESDVKLMGESQRSAFYAWIRWLHARADFADRQHLDADSIPDHTTPAVRAAVHDSLGGTHA